MGLDRLDPLGARERRKFPHQQAHGGQGGVVAGDDDPDLFG
jgi:hypothetical protein